MGAHTLRKQKLPTPHVNVGDWVLCGSRYSLPSEWYVAQVLWVGPHDVLTQHVAPSRQSEPYRQVEERERIRCVGSHQKCADFQEAANSAVERLRTAVHEAEQALQTARAAVARKIDELATTGAA